MPKSGEWRVVYVWEEVDVMGEWLVAWYAGSSVSRLKVRARRCDESALSGSVRSGPQPIGEEAT